MNNPTGLTLEEAQRMNYEELCIFWRFAPMGTMQKGDPVSDYICNKFNEEGGIRSSISKLIGWEKRNHLPSWVGKSKNMEDSNVARKQVHKSSDSKNLLQSSKRRTN